MRKEIIYVLGLFLLGLLAAGCAASTARETEALLVQEYRSMNNEELLRYYFQLTDQIVRVERQGRSTGVGVGIGTGVGIGSRSGAGVGVGVSRGIGGGSIAEELRERRNEVRVELSRRGVQP